MESLAEDITSNGLQLKKKVALVLFHQQSVEHFLKRSRKKTFKAIIKRSNQISDDA